MRQKMTPTKRTLARLRSNGWTPAVVERWNPYARIRDALRAIVEFGRVNTGYGYTCAQMAENALRSPAGGRAMSTPDAQPQLAGAASLIAIMCPHCKRKPHAIGWQCGECGRALKEKYIFVMPAWAFCPWCGSKLVPPNTTDSATPGGQTINQP